MRAKAGWKRKSVITLLFITTISVLIVPLPNRINSGLVFIAFFNTLLIVALARRCLPTVLLLLGLLVGVAATLWGGSPHLDEQNILHEAPGMLFGLVAVFLLLLAQIMAVVFTLFARQKTTARR